jgi:hypothetical protein
MEAETFANLTPEECEVLHHLLLRMRSNLLKATGEELPE